MLEGSGEREKGLPGASWAAGWRRRPLGSDGSWWKVEGGGIGRGAEPEPPEQTGQAGRAGPLLLLLQWRSREWGWASPGGFNTKEDIPVGKRHGLNVITPAVECCQKVMVNQQETLVLSP